MTTTSMVIAVLQALQARLQARPGLSGVRVFALPQGPQDLGREYIVLATRIPGRQEFPFASKAIKNDAFTLNGVIGRVEPGKGDEAALGSMQRVMDLFAEIEDALRVDPSLGGLDVTAQVEGYEHSPGATDAGRVHEMTFEVRVDARLMS